MNGYVRKIINHSERKTKRALFSTLAFLCLLATALMGISACKSSGSSAPNYSGDWFGGGISDWSGLTSVTEVSDTTARLNWTHHEQAKLYLIFYKQNPSANWQFKESILPPQTSYLTKGLTLNSTYYFIVKALNEDGRYDDNEAVQEIHTTLAPLPPVGITLSYPDASPGFYRTPSFTIHGVKPGDTVRLFSDDTCTNQLASGVVANDASNITLTSSTLAIGATYQVYANSTNIQGNTSACSTANATYQITACPNEFYIPIEANDVYGTDAFCVMKTEAKNDGNDVAVSQYEGTPWTNMGATNAKSACRRATAASGYHDLLSNHEWMVIARDIEATDANWSGGEVGTGMLNRGHSDSNPDNALSIEDPTDPWDQTGQDQATWSQKRTHILSSGAEIWDLAGNVSEFVDWETGSEEFSLGPTTCDGSGMTSPLSYECEDLDPLDYHPGNPLGLQPSEYMAGQVGIGKVRGGTGGAAVRGLEWGVGENAGIFGLYLGYGPTYTGKNVFAGFRCVWRAE